MGFGKLPETKAGGPYESVMQAYRGRVPYGLRYRALGSGTIEVTGGDDSADTFDPQVNGVSLVAAPVAWTSSNAATATAIATAINANQANHNYIATVSSATVTVMQRKSGLVPGALATVVVSDATTTDTDFSNDTDTWTEFISGATFDYALYYEISWSGTLLAVYGVDTDDARSVDIDLYCDGQALTFWPGGLRAAGNTIAVGLPLATATWLHSTYGTFWPILDPSIPFVIKIDTADEELLYSAGVI